MFNTIVALKVEFYFYLNKDKMNRCLKCSHKNFMKCAGPPCEGVCDCVSKYICDPLHKCKCGKCCRSKKSGEEVPLDPKTDMVRFKKYAKRKSSKKSIKKSNKKLKNKSKKKSVRKNKL